MYGNVTEFDYVGGYMNKFRWQHIQFANGSNPYICKTENEFKRIKRKYNLSLIRNGFWLVAEEHNNNEDMGECLW